MIFGKKIIVSNKITIPYNTIKLCISGTPYVDKIIKFMSEHLTPKIKHLTFGSKFNGQIEKYICFSNSIFGACFEELVHNLFFII